MQPATLSALAGFFSALVVLGVPLLGFLLRLYSDVQRVLSLVEGREAVEDDGVLDRLTAVEERIDAIEVTLSEEAGIEVDQSETAEAS
jgi:hypothetical protein